MPEQDKARLLSELAVLDQAHADEQAHQEQARKHLDWGGYRLPEAEDDQSQDGE